MSGSTSDHPRARPRVNYESALGRLQREGKRGAGGRLDVTKADVLALLDLGYGKAQVARALEISLSTLRRRLREADDGAGPL